MAYLHTAYESIDYSYDMPYIQNMPEVSRTFQLTEADRDRALEFLDEQPPHSAAMKSMIYDNGVESPQNRGTFYGYHDRYGNLDGVALIGHTTLVETRSTEARQALAFAARTEPVKMHVIVAEGDDAIDFWADAVTGPAQPRLVNREYLFEIAFPFPVRDCRHDLRLAMPEECEQIAEAQAEVAFIESGVDPLIVDREGFLRRVMRRIEQGRVFVVFEDGRLLFKADAVSVTTEAAHLEGVYVAEDRRGEGIGPNCLAEVARRLLETVRTVTLLSNSECKNAHRSFQKAGFRKTRECTAVFV